jgi:hypothetical protein
MKTELIAFFSGTFACCMHYEARGKQCAHAVDRRLSMLAPKIAIDNCFIPVQLNNDEALFLVKHIEDCSAK